MEPAEDLLSSPIHKSRLLALLLPRPPGAAVPAAPARSLIRTSREDGVNDVRRQQREAQDPTDVALRDFSASPISLTDV